MNHSELNAAANTRTPKQAARGTNTVSQLDGENVTSQLILAIRALYQHGLTADRTWCRECKRQSAPTCAWEGHKLGYRCDIEPGWWEKSYQLEVAAENLAIRVARLL